MSISLFKSRFLAFIRPNQSNICNIFNLIGLKLLTRLRLDLSHPNEHKICHNCQDCNNNPLSNVGKRHVLVNLKEKVRTKNGPYNIKSSEQQKLLEALIDNKLTFHQHIDNLCTNTSQKKSCEYTHKKFSNTRY